MSSESITPTQELALSRARQIVGLITVIKQRSQPKISIIEAKKLAIKSAETLGIFKRLGVSEINL